VIHLKKHVRARESMHKPIKIVIVLFALGSPFNCVLRSFVQLKKLSSRQFGFSMGRNPGLSCAEAKMPMIAKAIPILSPF